MNYDTPELRDRLAGEYVLGTMPSLARRRFERVMQDNATLAAAVAGWEARFAPLDADVAPVAPPARVWRDIERRIPAAPPMAPRPRFGGLALWRGLALGAAAACAALVLYIGTAPGPAAPNVVAVLADSGGQPSWVALTTPGSAQVSIDAIRQLAADSSHSLQLWGIAGGPPKPLGLLSAEPGRALRLAAATIPATGGVLAISLEPAGGSPTGLPTGPVLYQGKVLALP